MSLKCRNCGAVNPDGAISCQTCRITGRFEPSTDQGTPLPSNLEPSNYQAPSCRNCGRDLPHNTVEACPHCYIPIAKRNSAGLIPLWKTTPLQHTITLSLQQPKQQAK